MSDILCLNCLVLGDTLDRIFPVEIASTKNVGVLREAIKDKKQYTCLADQLDLYRTSEEVANLDDDKLVQALKIPLEEGGHSKLIPRHTLASIFQNTSPPEALHILVQLPSPVPPVPQATLYINCLVLGDTPDRIFPVEIARTKTVSALKEAIKDKKPHAFRSVDADKLDLCHVSLPNDDELKHKVHVFNFDKSLQPISILANIFIDVPAQEHLHIIVRPPFEGLSSVCVYEEQDDIIAEMNESFKRTVEFGSKLTKSDIWY
ncbi:hypothetical protein J3A83DRAFT_4272324 [Scleroderma citrinum]